MNRCIPNPDLETILSISVIVKFWIPAFAGMTPFGLKPQSPHSHSRVGGKVSLKLHEHKVRERSVNPDKKYLTVS